MTNVFDHPWLGAFFGDDAVAGLWSAGAQLDHYRAFETALARALAACGRVSSEESHNAADAILNAAIDIEALADATTCDGLPIPDFVRQMRAAASPHEAVVHTGATSQDVLDTALSLTLRGVTDVLIPRLQALDFFLAETVAKQGGDSLMGRTRMQAALPISVSDRVESWRRPLGAHVQALEALRPQVERLQLGGAVGVRAAFGAADIAAHMADALRLVDGPVWHTDRSGVTSYGGRLSMISGTLGKIGQDVALMAQQGVDEITMKTGGGSSAMPHKSNPVLAELLVTLARFNATQVAGLHHALVHEQERSGAAWMLEWMILPQMTVATARSLIAATTLVAQIERIGVKRITQRAQHFIQ